MQLLEQAEKTGRRKVLGIVGKPGAGKSTVAEVIVRKLLEQEMDKTTSSSSSSPSGQSTRWAIDSPVVLVPMDGFHMSNRVLAAIGLADRKGRRLHHPNLGFRSQAHVWMGLVL